MTMERTNTDLVQKWTWIALHLGAAAPTFEEWRKLSADTRQAISNALYDLLRAKRNKEIAERLTPVTKDREALARQVMEKECDELRVAIDMVIAGCADQEDRIAQLRKENQDLRSRPCSHGDRGFDAEFRKLRAVLDKAGIRDRLGTLSEQVEELVQRHGDSVKDVLGKVEEMIEAARALRAANEGSYPLIKIILLGDHVRSVLKAMAGSSGEAESPAIDSKASEIPASEATDAEVWQMLHPDKFIAKAINTGLTSQEDGDTPEERRAIAASRQVYHDDKTYLPDYWMSRLFAAAREVSANHEPSVALIHRGNFLRIAIRYARAAGMDAKIADLTRKISQLQSIIGDAVAPLCK